MQRTEMRGKKLHFYYFSGTGNTLRVVQSMKIAFEPEGISVSLFAIEKTCPSNVSGEIIGWLFL